MGVCVGDTVAVAVAVDVGDVVGEAVGVPSGVGVAAACVFPIATLSMYVSLEALPV